jgi:hypothetical protein
MTPPSTRSWRRWLNFYAVWDQPEDDRIGTAWSRRWHEALRPNAAPGQYVNFLGRGPEDAAAREAALAAYGDARLARLRALKRRWDPDNVFRLNHNIEPAEG